MQVVIQSIAAVGPPTERTNAFGQYRVVLRAGEIEQVLTYRVKLTPSEQSVSWQPPDSILSDRSIDVLVVAAVTDAVVAFHRGETVALPRTVSPRPVGQDTAVIRL
jgi:hypothetical protein